MSTEIPLERVTTTIRTDEVVVIDEMAAELEHPYVGNRSAALRVLLREAMDARGISVDLDLDGA